MVEMMCPIGKIQKKEDTKTTTNKDATTKRSGTGASPSSTSSPPPLNAWSIGKSQLTSTNIQVQRAAIELLSNLSSSTWVRTEMRGLDTERRMLRGERVDESEHRQELQQYEHREPSKWSHVSEDLRLLLVFALSDDLQTQLAATGALAMISDDPLLARKIMVTRCISYVPIDSTATTTTEEKDDDGHRGVLTDSSDDPAPPSGTRAIVRNGASILRQLRESRQTHPDVRIRIDVLQRNVDEANATAAAHAANK